MHAQISNSRLKWIKISSLPSSIDTLTIHLESLHLVVPADTSLKWVYDSGKNSIKFLGKKKYDSVLISYRVFPFNLNSTKFKRDPLVYNKSLFYQNSHEILNTPKTNSREEFFTTTGLNKTGSITRGISFGNTQNVFVDAALNLQLEGKISEDITVVAAISDQNVPFQPEGNTQQLQQFDKVFVQLAAKKAKLTVGDNVMRNPLWTNGTNRPSQFLRYYKNVQGGQLDFNYHFSEKEKAFTSVGGAVAKGKFASIFVDAIEGVQGPYRLRGPNNERFIIVLANSEKVYIDGRLLIRGFNRDYIIDYNLAEIIINPNTIITKFTRIRVDFEYSERNYSRTIVTASHQQTVGKLHIFSNYYSEKDNPRNPILVTLSDSDKVLLSSIGNDLSKAIAPAITEVSFNGNQVLYRKTDTLINGILYPIFIYSTNSSQAKYQLQFSDVGLGNGNYILKSTITNGRIYEWVGPVNNVKQGNYEPVRQLPTPTKKQMFTIGGEYQLNQSESFIAEGAYSDKSLNLFSHLDNSNNTAAAFKAGYFNKGKPILSHPNYQWLGSIDAEIDQKNFSPIDRFRDIDFDRDWSLRTDTLKTNEDRILNFSIGIQQITNFVQKKDSLNQNDSSKIVNAPVLKNRPANFTADKLIYKLSRRQKTDIVDGWQHKVEFSKQINKIAIKSNMFLLNAAQQKVFSEWFRVNGEINYQLPFVVPGYVFGMDKNALKSITNRDSVVGTAMNYTSHTFYLQNVDSLKTKFRLEYIWREDNAPTNGKLFRNDISQTFNGNMNTKIGKNQELSLLTTYRNLTFLNFSQKSFNEETVMGRIDWNGDFLNRNLRSELTYNIGSGRELRKEYVFLKVPTGQGTHTWRDDNKDGIQQLNEFYEAINPDERNYIKVFTQTDQYIRAYTQNFNYRLNLSAPISWKALGGLKGFIGRLSNVTSWTILRKIKDEDLKSRFIPFKKIIDSLILSDQNSIRTVVFFNRTNPKYGLDFNFLSTNQKQLLTNGFESRNNREYRINTRLNLNNSFNLKTTIGKILRINKSDFLSNRNFYIQTIQGGPELTWQPKADFRVSINYLYAVKNNLIHNSDSLGREKANVNQFGLESRLNKVGKRSITGTIKYIQIGFKNGNINTPTAYEMLEALRPGVNWNWSLIWQQKLTNGLQLNFTYEGRKSEGQAVIQLGRVQVSALF